MDRKVILMSQITKLIIWIPIGKTRSLITLETGHELKLKLKMISEKEIQTANDVSHGFIDYANVWDKIRHKDLFEPLGKLNVFGRMLD